jgi:hypothetical protein
MNLIFHLNILANPAMIQTQMHIELSRMLAERFGGERAWFDAYTQILTDWDSYHADLNFSGDDGMADMREARFRVIRAMFRIVGIAEPSQDQIHALADEAISTIPLKFDFFGHYSKPLILDLASQYHVTIVSYFPEVQLVAMTKNLNIQHRIGADTFEQYEMNQRYFEMLLTRLNAKPEDCILIDRQAQVLEAASQRGMKTFSVEGYPNSFHWYQLFYEFLAKEMP